MSTPKIRLKIDRSLDVVAERDKLLRPVSKIRDMILSQESETMRVQYLERKRTTLGSKFKNISVKSFMKRYPNIFQIYTSPCDNQPWCRLTKEMVELLEEEKKIYGELESEVVEKLRRLLMMAKNRRIPLLKLQFARPTLGLPHDFATRLVPKYPQFFRFVGKDSLPILELVVWDENLAISEFEVRAKEDACEAGLGEIETRGQPLAFKVSYSPGMSLRRKNLELLDAWQKLPYISPYQDWSQVPIGTPASDKRIVALLHEVLCLTVEKKFLVAVISRFREEFGLPKVVARLFDRFPGIFYLSLKGNVKTIILRERYKQPQLIEDHPLVRLKAKYAGMVRAGPKLFASQLKAKEEVADANAVTDEIGDVDDKQLEVDNETQLEVESETDDHVDAEDHVETEDHLDSEDDGSHVDHGHDFDENEGEDRNKDGGFRKVTSKVKREIW